MLNSRLTGRFEQYYLAARFPRIWQTSLLRCGAYSIIISFAAILTCAGLTADLNANAIPDLTFWFRIFLLASGIATLIWIFQ
jgi:hypothetical protein